MDLSASLQTANIPLPPEEDLTITVEGFDVFDTVLTRLVSPPSAVFRVVGEQLRVKGIVDLAPADFALQREQAERRSFTHRSHANNIFDIYRELTDALMLDPETGSDLAHRELEIEKQMTTPVQWAVDELERCRAEGKRVIFISDMYFPEAMLRELLSHHGVLDPQDNVYVSCDHAKHKSTGELFSHVLEVERLSADEIIYHGNSYWPDVRGAEKVGIEPAHRPDANPNRYEEILEAAAVPTGGLSASFAGAARCARLSVKANTPHDAVLRDVAASVAAPILISFVYWTLRRADQMGIKRLFFLSRDGQVLFEIAQRLVAKWDLDIDCSYIYASRQAWGQGFHDEAVRHWVWGDVVEGTTLRDILGRLSVDLDEVREGLSTIGFGPDRLDDELSYADVDRLRALFDQEEFIQGMSGSRAEHRRKLGEYLSGVGMFDNIAKGIVDIGWSGTLHESLSILLESEGSTPAHAFFFGLNQKDTEWKDYRHGFYFDSNRNLGLFNPLERKNLFVMCEVFCAADHGTVTGFEQTATGVEATLAPGWADKVNTWGLPIHRETIDAVVDLLHLPDFRGPTIAAMREPLGEIIETFWKDPTIDEAQSWGSFPWDAGQGTEDKVNSLVRPYGTADEFLRSTVMRSRAPYKNNVYWAEGSVAVSPSPFKVAVKATNRVLDQVISTYKKVERRIGNRSPR